MGVSDLSLSSLSQNWKGPQEEHLSMRVEGGGAEQGEVPPKNPPSLQKQLIDVTNLTLSKTIL